MWVVKASKRKSRIDFGRSGLDSVKVLSVNHMEATRKDLASLLHLRR